tara:strand:+ start:2433 stop:3356 length:924 start_codon:yes stop_codon:yes gene_type:complete
MKVSVVIPAYNCESSIEYCIHSIYNQTYKVHEVVIINDGSTDRTLDKLEFLKNKLSEINLKVYSQNNKGIAAARNYGIKESSGEYIAFLDSDDCWYKNKIYECSQVIKKKNVDLIYHDEVFVKYKNKFKKKYGYLNKPYFYNLIFLGNNISTSTVFMRKSITQDIGFFNEDTNFNSAEDFDYWLRIAYSKKYNFYYINKYLGEYIVTSNSITSKRKYHYEKSKNVLFYHLKKINMQSKFIESFKEKTLFLYLFQELKFSFKNKEIYKTFTYFLKLINIFIKSNKYIFINFLFKNKKFLSKISGEKIQ